MVEEEFSRKEERREDGRKQSKMLPKKNRLQKKKDINDAFRKGKTKSNSFFVIKLKNNCLRDWRFGFIVSQKISKKATVRNKIRRRLHGIINNKLKNPTSREGGMDVLVIARPGLEKEGFSETEKSLLDLFSRKI